MAPSVSGITTDNATGERHIPSSTRADGSQRREIRVRPGYRPPEDVELYKNRTAAAWKNRGSGGVPGAESLASSAATGTAGAGGGAASSKNAKKREAKRRAKAAEGEADAETGNTTKDDQGKASGPLEQESWRAGAGPEGATGTEQQHVDAEAEQEKKARNLKKKLRQARDLSEKKDKGENLLPEQFEKVIKIQELIRQLDALGFDAEGDKKQKSGEAAAASDDKSPAP